MLNYTEYLNILTYYRMHGWEPYLAWLRVYMWFHGRARRFCFRTVKIVQQLRVSVFSNYLIIYDKELYPISANPNIFVCTRLPAHAGCQ
jgi:hypothetical protein